MGVHCQACRSAIDFTRRIHRLMTVGFGIIGFRDIYDIRPIFLGSRLSASGEGSDYMMASESVALQQLGFRRSNMQDVLPGQALIIQKGCAPVIACVQPQKRHFPDIKYHNLYPRRMEEWLISGRYCYFT